MLLLLRLPSGSSERNTYELLREELGHWECDLVLSAKNRDDDVLLTRVFDN